MLEGDGTVKNHLVVSLKVKGKVFDQSPFGFFLVVTVHNLECIGKEKNTFSSHAHFQALFQSTILALVSMVLIDRTGSVTSTSVRQVPPYGTFKERFAT